MMVVVGLLPLLCLIATCSAFDDAFSPKEFRNYYLENIKIPTEVPEVEVKGDIVRSTNRQSFGYSQPGCPNSDTLQALMKLLVHMLVKQQEKRNGALKTDQLSQVVALSKKHLRSSKLTKENEALLNKLLEIERNLKKNRQKKEEAKIVVTFELPVPSDPACLNALHRIVANANYDYKVLKRDNRLGGRSNNVYDRPTPLSNAGSRKPTLQDLLNVIDNNNSPLNGDNIDIINYLNNYRLTSPNTRNQPSINNNILPFLNYLKLKDPRISGINEDQPSKSLLNKKNPYGDDGYNKYLLSLLNNKKKHSQNDLLSLLLSKNKENKNHFYDPQGLENQRPFERNPYYLNSTFTDNLAKGNNGIVGTSDGLMKTQSVPGFGEIDPTQDLLNQFLPSQVPNFNSKPKTIYPNPLQDPPLSIEAIDEPYSGPPIAKKPFLNDNLQDLNTVQFDPNNPNKSPYDTNALGRIMGKLKYATSLANNLNKLRKRPNKPLNSILRPNYGHLNGNDDVSSLLRDNRQQGPYDDSIIPSFYNDKIDVFDPPYGNNYDQSVPGANDPTLDVPGESNVYKLTTLPNQTGVLELTYLLNRPVPMAEPFYFVKYKIPYETFALNFQKLLREQSVRPRSPEMFYKDLLLNSSLDVVDSPNDLGSSLDVNFIDQVLKNGTLLDAKVVDDNLTDGFAEVTVKTLSSDDDVVRLINVLTHEKELERENFKTNSRSENVARQKSYLDDYIYRSDNISRKQDVSSASLAAIHELRNKVKEIWSPNFLQRRPLDNEEETITSQSTKSEDKINADKSDESDT